MASHRGDPKPYEYFGIGGVLLVMAPFALILLGCLLLYFVDGPAPIVLIVIGWELLLIDAIQERKWWQLVTLVGGMGLFIIGAIMRIRYNDLGGFNFTLLGGALMLLPDDLLQRWPFKPKANAGAAQRRNAAS